MSTQPENSGSSSGGAPSGGPGAGAPPSDPQKAWRESFDAFERAIGRPLEAFLGSEEFADAAAKFLKANSEMQSSFQQSADAWRQTWSGSGSGPGQDDLKSVRSDLDHIRRQLTEVLDRLSAIEGKVG